jgi:hypothetical protein
MEVPWRTERQYLEYAGQTTERYCPTAKILVGSTINFNKNRRIYMIRLL